MLTSREKVIPWGVPQIEDRALDTAQREWGAYQGRLEETQTQLCSALTRLRQVGQKFLSLAQWLEEMEKVANIRCHRRSDKAIKETQLRKLQVREGFVFSVFCASGALNESKRPLCCLFSCDCQSHQVILWHSASLLSSTTTISLPKNLLFANYNVPQGLTFVYMYTLPPSSHQAFVRQQQGAEYFPLALLPSEHVFPARVRMSDCLGVFLSFL